MRGWAAVVRKYACASLALLLIASGRVRRAHRKTLGLPVVTSLYFHRPRTEVFVACIRWLQQHGYTFISGSELADFLNGRQPVPKGAVWLSFDDGHRELLDGILPYAAEHSIPVTLFVPSGIVAGDGLFPWLEPDQRHALTVEELKAAARSKVVTIGSHTVTHVKAPECSDEVLARELRQSKRDLEAWTGGPVELFSYPYGLFDQRVVEATRAAGYKLAATVKNNLVRQDCGAFTVPRYSIGDRILFPEAVCNMVGVWRPAIDPLKNAVAWCKKHLRPTRPAEPAGKPKAQHA